MVVSKLWFWAPAQFAGEKRLAVAQPAGRNPPPQQKPSQTHPSQEPEPGPAESDVRFPDGRFIATARLSTVGLRGGCGNYLLSSSFSISLANSSVTTP